MRYKKINSKKNYIVLVYVIIVLIISACINNSDILANEKIEDKSMSENTIKIIIEVNGKIFNATLLENDTTREFNKKLPLKVSMGDLNNNEKYYYLNSTLPTDSKSVGRVNNGDIMLYGNNCLVIFYKSFSTSYSYTRLGKIDDVSGFTETLGRGMVDIIWSFPEN